VYEPNFPVFRAAECAEFRALCDEMAQQVVALFEKRQSKLERAFRTTDLASEGWQFSDITQCLYTNMYRRARTMLEQRGILTSRQKHANGAEWIFWAEEHDEDASQDKT
jgi:NAD(P)H-flavin reductase